MRISQKKIILFIILFLLLVGLILGAVYLKNVADYKQAVKIGRASCRERV